MANKMRTRSHEFFCVVAKNTRNGKHIRYTIRIYYSDGERMCACVCFVQTEQWTPRQDGDNVRHMHLIDLHLVKRSVSLRSIHEHRHQWTSANAAAQHKQNKNKRNCRARCRQTNERERGKESEWAFMGDSNRHGVCLYPIWYCHSTMDFRWATTYSYLSMTKESATTKHNGTKRQKQNTPRWDRCS